MRASIRIILLLAAWAVPAQAQGQAQPAPVLKETQAAPVVVCSDLMQDLADAQERLGLIREQLIFRPDSVSLNEKLKTMTTQIEQQQRTYQLSCAFLN